MSPVSTAWSSKCKGQSPKARKPHPLYLASEEDPVALLPHVRLDGVSWKNRLNEASLVCVECVRGCGCEYGCVYVSCAHVGVTHVCIIFVYRVCRMDSYVFPSMYVCMDMCMQCVYVWIQYYVCMDMCIHVWGEKNRYCMRSVTHKCQSRVMLPWWLWPC